MGKLFYILAFILSSVLSTNTYFAETVSAWYTDGHETEFHEVYFVSNNIDHTQISYLMAGEKEIENDNFFTLGFHRILCNKGYAKEYEISLPNQTSIISFILFETDNSPPTI